MTTRDIRGRFAVTMTLRRKIYLAMMIALLLMVFTGKVMEAYVDGYLKADIVYKAAPLTFAYADEIKPNTIEEMKNDVLDRLSKCENPNQKPIVFDTNGVASVGNFQWQPHSFQHYWEKKTGQKLSEKEAVIYALDDTKARELASYVIFDTDKGVGKDWFNCNKWHSLDDLVAFIKSHE